MAQTIDKIILFLLVALVIKGIWRGFTKEVISLLAYGIAFLAATSQLDNGTRFFETRFGFHPVLGYFASYAAVFMIVFLIVKFFIKNIKKMFRKEIESGLIDSLGGAVFGFCLGMLIVGQFLFMLKPVPVMDQVFTDKNRSIFIPIAEKYAIPVLEKVMGNPADKLPMDQLLSKGLGENMVMPDMMKGLLGNDIGKLVGDATKGISIMKDQNAVENMMNKAGDGSGNSEKPKNAGIYSGYQQALKHVGVDSTAPTMSTKDLMKLLKKDKKK